MALVIIIGLVVVVGGFAILLHENAIRAGKSPAEFDAYLKQDRANVQWGPTNSALVCPHCNTRGHVRVKAVTKKSGVSGGKATGALLTGGVSLLATGLSRKESVTQAHCANCNSTWQF